MLYNKGNGNCVWINEFIDFFCTVLGYLKKEFPNEKIGGPALCYANKEYLKSLLEECQKRAVTPDFISWHAYWYDPAALIKIGFEMRELLDEYGFNSTGLHLKGTSINIFLTEIPIVSVKKILIEVP